MNRKFLLLILFLPFIVGCSSNHNAEFVRDISCYSDYSTVEWRELRDKYYRPSTADWSPEIDSLICDGFPMELACEYWHLLQNARTDFHQKSLSLIAKTSKDVVKALNNTETMFDTVFVRCVSQEYYMRLFPEMYNETMKPAIDELVKKLNK